MSEVNFTIEQAKRLHVEGKAELLHSRFDTGLLKAAVFGANDGIITTFAVVAGVAGANLSAQVVLILGIANMVADAISMGLGDFLGERSEQRHRKHQYAIEKWEIKNLPDEETKELKDYFQKKGLEEEDTKKLASIIKKYPRLWSELSFVQEMGVAPKFERGLWKSGVVTFIAFLFAGTLPLTPYLLQFAGFAIQSQDQFLYSIIATISALFSIGSLRTLVSKGTWWKNGLEMLLIGTIAATASYFLGAFVKQLL